MQGMMTFVRVLPPDRYDEVIRRMQKGEKQAMPKNFDPEIGAATRWQKGQPSPNPNGRPKKTILTEAFREVLAQPAECRQRLPGRL